MDKCPRCGSEIKILVMHRVLSENSHSQFHFVGRCENDDCASTCFADETVTSISRVLDDGTVLENKVQEINIDDV